LASEDAQAFLKKQLLSQKQENCTLQARLKERETQLQTLQQENASLRGVSNFLKDQVVSQVIQSRESKNENNQIQCQSEYSAEVISQEIT
jgi:hypothetical protein